MIDAPAILIDTTRCVGCEECVTACKEENGLGKDRPWRGQSTIDDLSATRNCTVHRRPGDTYVLQQCRHCIEPACVSACLVGAMQKTPEGPVVYDPHRCMGCRYCMVACPYGIPRYDWDRAVPVVHKCTMCYHRLQEGGVPACVEACPQEATVFGTRTALLAEARRRISEAPNRYLPHVWGENEVGGTSVLYVSGVSLSFLAWSPELGNAPLPALSWQALEKVPPVVFGMGALMGGIYWFANRRMKVALAEAQESAASATVVDDVPEDASGASDGTAASTDGATSTDEAASNADVDGAQEDSRC
jgi:formate dehydrogenase iron-sulfur subunit